MATADDVRRIALSLPETIERPWFGTPGWRVRGRSFARIREEGDVLVVYCADLADKDALIASDARKFFTTPHYDGYAVVLVRLPEVGEEELRELLVDGWRVRAPKRVLAAYEDELG